MSGGQRQHAIRFAAVARTFRGRGRDVTALRDVSFAVEAGGIAGLVGPDGAGKSTLMRIAAGLLEMDAGRVDLLGMDVGREFRAVQATVGYMPQRFGLYEELSVRENLDLYADLQGVAPERREERYRELLHMTGLGPFLDRLAGRLSGGMKQKLGLACTLVSAPPLLLLDEPTVGVDPLSRRELWGIIDRLVREQETTVLISTAYLDEAERCDTVAMLYEGELLGVGRPQDFGRELEGRAFELSPRQPPRQALAGLQANPAVLDAAMAHGRIRLLLKPSAPPPVGAPDAPIEPVPPRFEDSFVARLRERRPAPPPVATPAPPAPFPRDGDEAVIAVHDLSRRYGDFYAVKGISFDVKRGEVFGLLGANGAGKSTTFRMLCGLLPASGGRLRVAGVDLRHAAARARARIGYMSQRFALYGILSVVQNLEFFASSYGLKGRERRARIDWALEQFELAPFRDVNSAELSLGHKQRLAMASALMHEPEILFLDEPTSGVDPLARREFWHRINALAEAGVTVMVTTHFMEEAEYCDRIAIMAAGEILTLGTPAAIRGGERSLEDAFIGLIEAHGAAA